MIDRSSSIANKLNIHPSVKIGPFCYIGENVKIGKNCKLVSHVSLNGNTEIGENNIFHPFCSIGSPPQDLKYKGEKNYLLIGDNNTFRENVTVNPGTSGGGLKTTIENNCLLMVGSHVAHDCKIKSNVILANNATLAGHVEIFENAIIGGNSAIHQFVKIGKFAMIGGMSGVEKDIIPYGLYIGIRTNLKGINIIGLKRKGLSNDTINNIVYAIKDIFNNVDPIEKNIKVLRKEYKVIKEVEEIISFILSNNRRGIAKIIDE